MADRFRARMKETGITNARLASAMKTSRTVTTRLLDPADTGVTLDTLVRASDALGLVVDMSFSERAPKSETRTRAPRRQHAKTA